MRFFIGLLSILLLASCREAESDAFYSTNYRSHAEKRTRMITTMNYIIQAIADFDISHVNHKNFYLDGYIEYMNPRLVFLGENHLDFWGQIKNLGAINALASKGNLLLLEGDDKAKPFFDDCGRFLVYRIYLAWEYKSLNRPYRPNFMEILEKQQNLDEIYLSTRHYYDLTGLNIANIRCGYWDSKQELKKSVTYLSLKKRNRSMIEAIQNQYGKTDRIFINAGFLHLPLGEKLWAPLYQGKYPHIIKPSYDYKTIYSLIKEANKLELRNRNFAEIKNFGASAQIYKFLINNSIPHIQLIPRNAS
jgi:hypothetical protein